MAHILKRLELNGFKSFANKTVLEFPAGITGIVGPNGSGKSNIVDAFRWLLGERDAKSLRGGRIDDLIFAGTPARARVGQATATLYFENRDKFFPVDFEEVSVSRVVNRDGQSRYILNRSEVLLRDLVDFFAKARLGSRGIVVVTQGNSDMFIQATPTQRREMLEEILGLKEYQIKRRDAVRRLQLARENLVKINALIEEIIPHLRLLQRQTKRWQRRSEVESELGTVERLFYGSQLKDIVDARMTLERDHAVLDQAHKNLLAGVAAAQAQLDRVNQQKPVESDQAKLLKEKSQKLLELRGQLQMNIGRLEGQINILSRAQPSGKESNLDSRVALQTLQSIQARLKKAVGEGDGARVREIIAAILDDIEKVFEPNQQSQSAAVSPDIASMQAELIAVKDRLTNADEALREIEREQQSAQQASYAYYGLFQQALDALSKAKEELERSQNKKDHIQLELERFQMRFQELERSIIENGKRVEDFSGTPAPSIPAADLSTAQTRMIRLRNELAAIGQIDEMVVREADETQQRHDHLVAEAADLESAIKDLVDLIAQLQEKMAREFETAIASINHEFKRFFELMFAGGTARLQPVDMSSKSEEKNEAGEASAAPEEGGAGEPGGEEEEFSQDIGIEIKLSLPRKRIATLDALSGGERSLVGIAAIFALISVSPPPFLVLDEIDAPLDERNARRFSQMLKDFSHKTQFVIVTHNRVTMEVADVLYGVTPDTDGTSKVLSIKFENH